MTDLERAHAELSASHDKLRAAVIFAGREIRRLNFGRKDSETLKLLREVLREARRAKKLSESILDPALAAEIDKLPAQQPEKRGVTITIPLWRRSRREYPA